MFNKEKSDERVNNYLAKSVDLTERSRAIDWIIVISYYFKLLEKTIALAVECFDIYINKKQLSLDAQDYQFIALASLFMASKYEEIYPPSAQVTSKKKYDH